MKNLSEMMGGKVPGLYEPEPNSQSAEERIFGNVGTQKLVPKKLDVFDKKLGLFDKGKSIKMPDMYKLKGGNKKMSSSKKANLLMDIKPKSEPKISLGFNSKKKIKVDDKVKMLGSVNSSKTINKLNKQKKIISSMGTRKPGMNPQKAIKLQKNLPMFGDYDGDKVLNVFDCNPRNKHQQGTVHDFIGGVAKVGSAIGTGAAKVGEGVVTGTGKVWRASGIPGVIEQKREDMAMEREIREEARKEALAKVQEMKAQQIYADEVARVTGTRPPRSGQEFLAKNEIRGAQEGFRQATYSTGGIGAVNPMGMSEKIKYAFGGQYGTGQGIAMMTGSRQQPQPFVKKVGEAVGLRKETIEGLKQQQEIEMAQPQMQQHFPQQPMSIPDQQLQQPRPRPQQRREDKVVYSPYSKRRVTYTRGPYKKRTQYAAQAQY